MCCRVNRCCFCLSLPIGVKVLCMCLMAAEVGVIVLGVFFLPRFLFAIAPTSAIGIVCHALLLVAVFRESRWFVLPWLIYIMILIVGLGLAAVLRIVIPLGSYHQNDSSMWLEACLTALALLVVAAVLLYFWIVVLELFIRLGQPPSYMMSPQQQQQQQQQMSPYMVEQQQYPMATVQFQQPQYQPAASIVYQAYPAQYYHQ